jgi:hypothetical protein
MPLDGKTEIMPSPLPAEPMLPAEPRLPMPTPESPAPAPAVPAVPAPDEGAADELSSRRTAEHQAQYLETLRWAPADSR